MREQTAVAVCLLLTVVLASSALANRSIVWEAPATLDTGVAGVSSSRGVSVLSDDAGFWHVVYAKNGAVRYVRGSDIAWEAPIELAPAFYQAVDPHISACGNGLIVVFEATGPTGHPEVYACRNTAGVWGSPEGVTVDAIPSRKPVVAPGHSVLNLVAYEDETGGLFRVRCRRLTAAGWQAWEEVSTSVANGRDPSLAGYVYPDGVMLVWSDARHGEPEIYERARGESAWGPETRLTNLTGSCRNPASVIGHTGDLGYPVLRVGFEVTVGSGAAESWAIVQGVPQAFRLAGDGSEPARYASVNGFYGQVMQCGMLPSGSDNPFACWTEEPSGGGVIHRVAAIEGPGDVQVVDELPASVHSPAALAFRAGEPLASVTQIWVDEIDGVLSLRARHGTTAGCHREQLQARSPLLLGPAGRPPTVLQLLETCSMEGLPGYLEFLDIGSDLEGQLNWAPEQSHPMIWGGESDSAGYFHFYIGGGGCAYGSATAMIGTSCILTYDGAKSPDVNGDCVVGPDDLAYVESKLGTGDFCADFDGSGTVGPEDVAVVTATMGDQCSQYSGVADGDRSVPSLRCVPNPCTDRASFVLRSVDGRAGTVTVYDAAGRAVWSRHVAGAGEAVLAWDLRREGGAPAASGWYYAVARLGGTTLRAPVLVVR